MRRHGSKPVRDAGERGSKPLFRLTIDTGNQAFDQRNGATEVSRILREIADQLDKDHEHDTYRTIFDVNGNDVGRYRLADE